jgi:hypothetical protein
VFRWAAVVWLGCLCLGVLLLFVCGACLVVVVSVWDALPALLHVMMSDSVCMPVCLSVCLCMSACLCVCLCRNAVVGLL